jgi:integrase
MASVFKRDDFYVVKWRDASGRWRQKRTSFETKAEARRFAQDLEQKTERQRRGLDPLPTNNRLTFAELVGWWWRDYGSRLRSRTIKGFVDKHLLPTLGPLTAQEVSPPRVEELLNQKDRSLKPRSVNHLRQIIHRIFSIASKRGLWIGANPAASVERRKVSKRLPNYLRADEVPKVLAALALRWQPLFATAVYTAMRQGELLGLRKSDVDLVDGTITVARSYDGPTTKGGHADVLPIAEALKPYLVTALQTSTSDLVFPRADGSMHSRDLALDVILRRAMGRAGIVTGYLHKCRRKGCGYEKEYPHSECGRCPKCNMLLWAKPLPRHIRFHDTRHTTVTLLLKEGVPLATVQRIVRHKDPRLTTEIYGHLDVEDMRRAVNRLQFSPLADADESSEPVPENGEKLPHHGAPVVRKVEPEERRRPRLSRITRETAALKESGRQDLNLRPLGPEPSALPG